MHFTKMSQINCSDSTVWAELRSDSWYLTHFSGYLNPEHSCSGWERGGMFLLQHLQIGEELC